VAAHRHAFQDPELDWGFFHRLIRPGAAARNIASIASAWLSTGPSPAAA